MEEKLEVVDCMVLNCALDVRVRNEDIDDIMVSALEGGNQLLVQTSRGQGRLSRRVCERPDQQRRRIGSA